MVATVETSAEAVEVEEAMAIGIAAVAEVVDPKPLTPRTTINNLQLREEQRRETRTYKVMCE